MKYSVLLAACLLAFSGNVFGQDARFTLTVVSPDVEDGGTVSGSAGSTVTINYDVVLEATEAGAQAVVAPLAGEGASIEFTDPLCAPNDNTCAGNEFGVGVFFYTAEAIDPTKEPTGGALAGMGPQGPGIVSSLTLNIGSSFPAGSHPTTRGTFTITIPETAETVRLFFQPGLQGSGTPQNPTVPVGGSSTTPQTTEFTFTVQPTIGGIIPGDTDANGELNVMDIIEYLDHYFIGDPAELPCGDGTIFDAGNLALLDSNGDGELDIADAVHQLRAQFLDGPPHATGEACTTISGCPTVCDV